MFTLTDSLQSKMQEFKDVFGDIVPLREMPATATTEDIIAAIDKSIKEKKNLLPKIFGFQEDESNSDILF